LTHWQDGYNVRDVIHNVVVDGIGESLGKRSVEAMLSTMNACVENQGFYVGEETIPEVITNTGFK